MAYATVEDVTQLNSFPQVGTAAPGAPRIPPATVEKWIQLRSSELDFSLSLKGLAVPVTEPPALLDLLNLAVTYGAAAMLEGAPKVKQGDTEVNTYLTEYLRIKAGLEARTREELIGGDLLPGPTSTLLPPGLSLARNRRISRADCTPWYDAHPVRLV